MPVSINSMRLNHLLKFNDERQILKKAYYEYSEMRKNKEFLRRKFGESKS